jgi:hypothetical protein
MNTTRKQKIDLITQCELADIFNVSSVNGTKIVNRWGFYAQQEDGTYAIYRPQHPVCHADEMCVIEEDGPGDIEIVNEQTIKAFLDEVGHIRGIPAYEVTNEIKDGWYYDTVL